MATTVGEAVSRLRILIKSVKQEVGLSDRFLYSLIMKHGKILMRRQDNLNRIMKFNAIFKPLEFVELIDVDKVSLQCIGITSGCTIKRTRDKLPEMMEGYWGVLIREITSLDGSEDVHNTYPSTYEKISKNKYFKYNNKKYFWYIDGHLYFPNIDWDAVKLIGLFEGDISKYNCDSITDSCKTRQDSEIMIPEFLFSEIETMALRELTMMIQIPTDNQHDQQNIVS
ncbi:MAG: hypothetical protein KAH05_00070 [Clostridiales bacterium]|nr:hypothetical protein [Clostridiales bacterium]